MRRIINDLDQDYEIFNEDDQVCSNKDIFKLEPDNRSGDVLWMESFNEKDFVIINSSRQCLSPGETNGYYFIKVPYDIDRLDFLTTTELDECEAKLIISTNDLIIRIYSGPEYVDFKLPETMIDK